MTETTTRDDEDRPFIAPDGLPYHPHAWGYWFGPDRLAGPRIDAWDRLSTSGRRCYVEVLHAEPGTRERNALYRHPEAADIETALGWFL